jgi:hypothetical protein
MNAAAWDADAIVAILLAEDFAPTSGVLCDARAPSGAYRGFRCCAGREGHEGPHTITNGHHEPPYFVIAFEWANE